MNGRGQGAGRRWDERERLRHQEMQQPTERDGRGESRRCDGRGAGRGGGEGAGGQQAQHNERGAEQEPEAPTVAVFIERGEGAVTVVIGGGGGGGGGVRLQRRRCGVKKIGCCIFSMMMFVKEQPFCSRLIPPG